MAAKQSSATPEPWHLTLKFGTRIDVQLPAFQPLWLPARAVKYQRHARTGATRLLVHVPGLPALDQYIDLPTTSTAAALAAEPPSSTPSGRKTRNSAASNASHAASVSAINGDHAILPIRPASGDPVVLGRAGKNAEDEEEWDVTAPPKLYGLSRSQTEMAVKGLVVVEEVQASDDETEGLSEMQVDGGDKENETASAKPKDAAAAAASHKESTTSKSSSKQPTPSVPPNGTMFPRAGSATSMDLSVEPCGMTLDLDAEFAAEEAAAAAAVVVNGVPNPSSSSEPSKPNSTDGSRPTRNESGKHGGETPASAPATRGRRLGTRGRRLPDRETASATAMAAPPPAPVSNTPESTGVEKESPETLAVATALSSLGGTPAPAATPMEVDEEKSEAAATAQVDPVALAVPPTAALDEVARSRENSRGVAEDEETAEEPEKADEAPEPAPAAEEEQPSAAAEEEAPAETSAAAPEASETVSPAPPPADLTSELPTPATTRKRPIIADSPDSPDPEPPAEESAPPPVFEELPPPKKRRVDEDDDEDEEGENDGDAARVRGRVGRSAPVERGSGDAEKEKDGKTVQAASSPVSKKATAAAAGAATAEGVKKDKFQPGEAGSPWQFNLMYGTPLEIFSEKDAKWYPGRALYYLAGEESCKIKIHYTGYPKRWDETVDLWAKSAPPGSRGRSNGLISSSDEEDDLAVEGTEGVPATRLRPPGESQEVKERCGNIMEPEEMWDVRLNAKPHGLTAAMREMALAGQLVVKKNGQGRGRPTI
ncbi:hypothetical protein HDU96_003236 [Phlyctochytrium bullatum]|nr:hypothetical protein HDU96_003236 [Phlyctochytrium bullatum]